MHGSRRDRRTAEIGKCAPMVRRGAAGRPAGRLRLLLVLGLASGSEASCETTGKDPQPQFADKAALSGAISTYMADPDNYQYLGPCTWDVHLVTDFSQLVRSAAAPPPTSQPERTRATLPSASLTRRRRPCAAPVRHPRRLRQQRRFRRRQSAKR